MRELSVDVPVYVFTGVLDMRVGFERLSEKVKSECHRTVIAGGLYVFFSRSRDRVRIFYWDRDGYAMWQKRLEAGSFKVERTEGGYEELTSLDLRELLGGLDLSRIRFRKSAERGLYS